MTAFGDLAARLRLRPFAASCSHMIMFSDIFAENQQLLPVFDKLAHNKPSVHLTTMAVDLQLKCSLMTAKMVTKSGWSYD